MKHDNIKIKNKTLFLRQLIKISLIHKFNLIFIIFISIFTSYLSACRPKLIQQAIDIHLLHKDMQGFKTILFTICLFLFIESILHFFLLYFSNVLAQNVVCKIRTMLFTKLLNFKHFFFQRVSVGKIVAYSISDIETITVIFNDGILLVSGDIMKILMILIMMYTIHKKLSIIIFFMMPIMYIVIKCFQKRLKEIFHEERKHTSRLNSFLQESIVGMSVIQFFNKEKMQHLKFKSINKKLMDAHVKTTFYFSIFFPIIELLSSITISTVICYGGIHAIYKKDVYPGQIIAFVFFIYLLFRPMRQMADRFNLLQRGMAGIERIFSILNLQSYNLEEGKIKLKNIKGKIIFKNVFFYYPNHKKMILNGISFEINPGEKIAIVGPTGSGKSTIASLIPRFYEINKGNIYIDGHSIKDIKIDNLRYHIRTVPQDTFLFNDSIFNNITLGDPNIKLNKVEYMAKKIGIHRFIKSFPNGYKYIVQERGSVLSIGEKQLISFLRIQMHPYSILILDEITSSLNKEIEKMIYNAINILTLKKTSIIITHRISTLENMDKILAIKNGHLIEYGTHCELLKLNGYYAKLQNKLKK